MRNDKGSVLTLRKNDEIELVIEDIGTNGEGIGRVDGAVLFVRDAVPGDRILAGITKVKKTYAYARLIRILEPSPDRVVAPCPFAGPCGGCQLQAFSYEKQLTFKMKKVQDVFQRIAGISVLLPGEGQLPDEKQLPDEEQRPEEGLQGEAHAKTVQDNVIRMEPIIGMDQPWHYRNKAQFPVGTSADGRIITGFYAGRSHRIIENRDCMLGQPVNREILDVIISHMEKYGIPAYDEEAGAGLVRHVLIRNAAATGQILVCLIINGSKLPHAQELADALFSIDGMASFSININRKRTNVILGDELRLIRGDAYITEKLSLRPEQTDSTASGSNVPSGDGQITYCISPKSFFQVNPVQTEKLYAAALEFAGLTGRETVWDLYCGAGTISLFLAQRARHVYGVEIVSEAVEDAIKNAEINGMKNVTFFTGKAEELVLAFYARDDSEALRPDVVVVDPPRKGCEASLLETILKMRPDRIVYVSCDPATLARDVRILSDGGYAMKRIRPVDNFCQTVHVECVTLLSRIK